MVGSFLGLVLTGTAATLQSNAANVTIYALRPLNLVDITDKDSADAPGDIFFWYVRCTAIQLYDCFDALGPFALTCAALRCPRLQDERPRTLSPRSCF